MSDLIEPHIARLRAQGRSPHTIQDRREVLERLDRDLPHGLEQATDDEIELWLGRDGWSRQTRATYYGHVVGFYRWACGGRRPHLDYDPTAELERPTVAARLPRPLSDAEVTHAFEHLHGHHRDAATLALGAGMRVSEIARARGDHLTGSGLRIVGKGDKERYVPACPEILDLIDELGSGLLVPRPSGGEWPAHCLTMAARKALHAIGLRVSLHRFRHTFATRAVRNGVNIVALQRLMGHANLATTQVYADVYGSDLVDAVERLPAFGGSGRRGPGQTAPTSHASDQVSAA